MGIRPRGERERDISRHEAAERGERCPFGVGEAEGRFEGDGRVAFCWRFA